MPASSSVAIKGFLNHLVDSYTQDTSDASIVMSLATLQKVHRVPTQLLAILGKNNVRILRTDVRSQGIGRFLVEGIRGADGVPDGSVAVLDLPQVGMLLRMFGESDLPRSALLAKSSSLEDRLIGSVAEWKLGGSEAAGVS